MHHYLMTYNDGHTILLISDIELKEWDEDIACVKKIRIDGIIMNGVLSIH